MRAVLFFKILMCTLLYGSDAKLKKLVAESTIIVIVDYEKSPKGIVKDLEFLKVKKGAMNEKIKSILNLPRGPSLNPETHLKEIQFINEKRLTKTLSIKGFWIRENVFGEKYTVGEVKKLIGGDKSRGSKISPTRK